MSHWPVFIENAQNNPGLIPELERKIYLREKSSHNNVKQKVLPYLKNIKYHDV